MQRGIEFGQLFPAGLVEVENVDFSVFVAASEEVIAVVVEVDGTNGAALVVPKSVEQLRLLTLRYARHTCETSKMRT